MLPDSLAGSYRRYKEDTNIFVTWLSNTAEKCGYKIETDANTAKFQPSTRLKGKARKAAKNAEVFPKPVISSSPNHIITTREILVQAEMVARFKKPPIKMPITIWQILKRAIRARKRCATWFQGAKKDDESNSAHEHFIGILETVLDILNHCLEKSKLNEETVDIHPSTNRYGMLEVEGIDEESFDVKASDVASASENKSVKNVAVYQLEVETSVDLHFSVFCFFEDLHRMQEFLENTWTQVAEMKLDVLTAALIASLACGLVQQAEDELFSLHSSHFGKDLSYEALASILFKVATFGKEFEGVTEFKQPAPETQEVSRQAAFYQFIYSSTFLILSKYQHFHRLTDKSSRIDSVITVKGLQSIYSDQRPLFPGLEEEDRTLSSMLLELEDLKVYDSVPKENRRERVPPVKDELTKCLLSIQTPSAIRTSQVFITRIFLDMVKILGSKSADSYTDLLQRGATAYDTIGMKISKNEPFVPPPHEEELKLWGSTECAGRAMHLACMLLETVKDNYLVTSKKVFIQLQTHTDTPRESILGKELREKTGLEFESIWRPGDPTFLYKHNPIYCGLESLRIAVRMEQEGLKLCNSFSSLFAVAHLYNAVQQNHLIRGQWDLMDRAIAAHIGQFFNGALPVTHKEIHNRFLLRLGFPATFFAKDSRSFSNIEIVRVFAKADNILKTTKATNDILEYLNGKETVARFLAKLSIHRQAGSKGNGRGSNHQRKTPLEELTALREWVPDLLDKLETPWMSLARKCNILLLRIREAFKAELGIEHETDGMDTALILPQKNLLTVFSVLRDLSLCDKSERAWLISQNYSPGSGKKIAITARVMQDFLKEANTNVKVEPWDIPVVDLSDDYNYYNPEMRDSILSLQKGEISVDELRDKRPYLFRS